MVANPVFLWTTFATYLSWTIYPTLTGSKTPTSKCSESKEVRRGSTAHKPIGSIIISGDEENPTD